MEWNCRKLQIEVTLYFRPTEEDSIDEDEIKDFLKTSFEREMDYIEIDEIERKEGTNDTYILYFRKKNEVELEVILDDYIENEKEKVKENFEMNGFMDYKCMNMILGKPQKRKNVTFEMEQESTCGICLCEINEREFVRKLSICNHYFHKKCIDKWLKKNICCPMCRRNQVNDYIEKCFEEEKERIKERIRNKNIES